MKTIHKTHLNFRSLDFLVILSILFLLTGVLACGEPAPANLKAALENPEGARNLKLTLKPGQALSPKIGALKNLESLEIRDIDCALIPAELGHLSALKRLVIVGSSESASRNMTLYPPYEFSRMKNLEYLEISSCNLGDFPAGILELEKLKTLNLSSNRIEAIPTNLKNLKSLTFLLIANNRLKALPAELFKLPALGPISLRGNPFPAKYIKNPPDKRISF